jgi:hypothetical protein
MPAQKGLPPNPPAPGQGGGEDQVKFMSRGTGGSGGIVGSADLSQDFGFAKDLRIQSSADLEQVAHRCQTMFYRKLRCRAAIPGQCAKPGLAVLRPIPVELATVAGREQ